MQTEKPDGFCSRPIEQANRVRKGFVKKLQRNRAPQRNSFGKFERGGFRRKFAKDDMQKSNKRKSDCKEIVCRTAPEAKNVIPVNSPMRIKIGSRSAATAGSPTQPKPNEAKVMPSCVAEI
jgi:hypothetical protein